LLTGLCYSEELVSRLLERVHNVQESTTYQAILREGRIAGVQHFLVRQGTKRFGKPDSAILAAIEAIKDFERIAALAERLLDAEVRDWHSLLGTS